MTAHFLAELHDANNQKVFDTILVVSDRTVIDTQLQEALFDFQRQNGVVATITGTDGSKSGELAAALDGIRKIVVCTIQTFPFAMEAVRKLTATKGKRFAVIADEAHSSQSGEAASMLKAVLSPQEIAELAEGGEVTTEDIAAAEMTARAGQASEAGISYDDFEVDRVVEAEMKPGAKQSDLIAALEPVTDRLTKRYKVAQASLKAARRSMTHDQLAAEAAQNELNALILFKSDLGAFPGIPAADSRKSKTPASA